MLFDNSIKIVQMFFGTGTIERRDIRNRSHPANRGSDFISSSPTGRASVLEYFTSHTTINRSTSSFGFGYGSDDPGASQNRGTFSKYADKNKMYES